METLKATFDSGLKNRIEQHSENHYTLENWFIARIDGECTKCGADVKQSATAFFCTETTEDGGAVTMLFCNESEHDAYVTSGRPFEYEVAIDIARELGGKAGMIAFANWLFTEIEVNSKIDISPYIKTGSDNVELGDLPETLNDWEKQYVEEQFEFYKQELHNRLYESIVPKN